MPNTRNPLFSLAARGTVADTLTYQRHGNLTKVRSKPIPPHPLTLPVQYQRWLYEDYCYLWRQQSDATKATYRAAGSRHHLTAFQYWMKDMLTRLPDISAYWKLDINNQPTTPDSSRYHATGTVIGATPAIGPIHGALHFDGINDRVQAPDGPQFTTPVLTVLTLEALVRHDNHTSDYIITKDATAPNRCWNLCTHTNGFPQLIIWSGAVSFRALSNVPLTVGQWHHVCGTYDLTNIRIYLDGVQRGILPHNLPIDVRVADIFIGTFAGLTEWWAGDIDQVIVYNRVLDQTEIARHAARRWPPQ